MKQKLKKVLSFMLSLCLVLGMVQIPAMTGYAAAADGEIDTSEEGYQTVRYYTDTETAVTSAQTKSERVSDFFAGTESMIWSVDFKTTATKLQSLLTLEYSTSKYMTLFIKDGSKVGLETKDGTTLGPADAKSYTDGEWHTLKLELTKSRGVVLSLDDEVVTQTETAPTCIAGLSWTPDTFTIGGMTNYSSKSGWTFSGSMKNIVLKKEVAVPLPESVFEEVNPAAGSTSQDISTCGTLQFTYRLAEAAAGEVTLAELGTDGTIALNSDKVKITLGGQTVEIPVTNTSLTTTKWHNLAIEADGSEVTVYVDNALAGSAACTGTISGALRYGSDVYISEVKGYDAVLEDYHIGSLHATTDSTLFPDGTEKMEGYEKTANREIFNSGYDGAASYRIPAIVTSKKTGTVIASIDKRWNGSADVGIIDSVIRRSEDNGATWGDLIPVIDLGDSYGYTVDPGLVVDNDEDSEHYGRIYMLVDMFPSNIGFGSSVAGTGYTQVDGVSYRVVTDASGNRYTVREDGIVYDSSNNPTNYQVETEAAMPFTSMGDLYKDGVKIGNIFKNSELTILSTCYLWVTYSDDDGITWSTPKDITPMVKDEWMKFCGVGPGIGIQLQSGRLMFPVYCTNAAGVQSSFNVYSDDFGETWHQGGSPNNGGDMENATAHLTESCITELDNGHLMQFMRSYNGVVTTSVSTDYGLNWSATKTHSGIRDPYCQMASVHYPGKLTDPADGQQKEAIIFSNPNSGGRDHGTIRIAFVNSDDSLDWAYSKLIDDMRYCYSSVTVMNNGNIGLIYENESYATIGAAFTSFSPEYIMDTNTFENTPVPTGITASVETTDGQPAETLTAGNVVKLQVTFSQNVFAAGNVSLNIKVGDERKEAALVGNAAEDILEFAYTIDESDEGILTATGEVNVKDGGAAETIYNVSLTNVPYVSKEISAGEIAADGSSLFAELPTTGMTATAGSAASDGAASNVLDGNTDTIWHSLYPDDNGVREKHYITIALGGTYLVNGLIYTPRNGGGNGNFRDYQIEVSTNGTEFVPVATGSWMKNASTKTTKLDGAVLASHVRLRSIDSGDDFASAAEIRIIGNADTSVAEDKTALLATIIQTSSYAQGVDLTVAAPELAAALETAQNTAKDGQATAEQVAAAEQAVSEAMSSMANTAKEQLSSLITENESRTQADYNVTSWANLSTALTAAKAVTADSTDSEVISAYLSLLAAESALVDRAAAVAEKAEAKAVLDAATEKLAEGQGDYTDTSWNAYLAAVQALQTAYDRKLSADTLNTLAAEVTAAEGKLEKKQPDPTPTPDPTPNPEPGTKPNPEPGTNPNPEPGTNPTPNSPSLTAGKTYQTADGLKYKVTSVDKKTVTLVGTANKKKLKKLTVKATVKIEGVTCKVTAIGAKAFSNCKKLTKVTVGANVTTIGKQAFAGCGKLKTITIKSKVLKKVQAKAFKGINKKAVIKVPKAKRAKYKRLLAKKGQASSVKIK